MEAGKRVKRSEATWRELFERQASSGVTVAEFCRAEGINAGLFRRWRAALSGRVGGRARRRVRRRPVTKAPLIDLGTLPSAGTHMQIRLELGSGVVLSIARS
jgi:transposase-like protein